MDAAELGRGGIARRFGSLLSALVVAALGVVLAGSLAGCKGDAARVEEGLTAQLDLLATPSKENIEAAMGKEYAAQLEQLTTDAGEKDIDLYGLLGHALRGFTYEIGDVKVDGDQATVALKVRGLNVSDAMHAALDDFQSDANKSQVEQLAREQGEDGVRGFYLELLYKRLDEQEELVTTDVTVTLERQDKAWRMTDESMGAVIAAALGGLDPSSLQ